jgi:hypothetical protein
VIALPSALAPWADLLGLFPPDVAADLARWIPRLALAIGPMRSARPTGVGDPDGFSGIARRGSYERLLLTEWLLADELPDEFARRAAMGEHAFHELARRTPARAASSVALFDAGPDQLGALRVAHLAALLVLAERAERVAARFAWGILHDPEGALFTAVTAESVRSLLAARTALPPTSADAVAWSARAKQSGWEDAWLVGPAAPDGWRHASLEVRDVLEPERRALAVVVRSPGAPDRRAELELPDARACVRLLRDPFAVAAPTPRRQRPGVAPVSNLVFAANGTKLFARGGSGEILAYPVPNSPHAGLGHPKRFHPSTRAGVVTAVGWVKRGLVTLTVTEDQLILDHTNRSGPPFLRRTVARPADVPIAVSSPTDPLMRLAYRDDGGAQVFFLDAHRALHHIWRDRLSDIGTERADADATGVASVATLATRVSALAEPTGRIAFVGHGPREEPFSGPMLFGIHPMAPGQLGWRDTGRVLVLLPDGDKPGSFERLDDDGRAACFGFAEGSLGPRGILAVEHAEGAWDLHDDTRSAPARVTPFPGTRVVGVWRSGLGRAPELLVLDRERAFIRFTGGRGGRALPRAEGLIVDVTMCNARSQLAYATISGEVVIHSLLTDVPLARFLPPEPR